ncbi:MAG: ribosome recycling factor [Patescibacteria group bacterium]|jgi:ribosome recycling factor
MSIIDDAKPQFQKVIDHCVTELGAIRTGRASAAILEPVQVEAYGVMQPIKALAMITTPDSKTILIEPWDSSVVKFIEIAIQKSDVGINPVVDGKSLRLMMPMMTEETRTKMVKIMKEKLEDARVSLRKVREEARKSAAKLDGGEDEKRRIEEAIEKVVKEYTVKIDELGEKKEKEITTI